MSKDYRRTITVVITSAMIEDMIMHGKTKILLTMKHIYSDEMYVAKILDELIEEYHAGTFTNATFVNDSYRVTLPGTDDNEEKA